MVCLHKFVFARAFGRTLLGWVVISIYTQNYRHVLLLVTKDIRHRRPSAGLLEGGLWSSVRRALGGSWLELESWKLDASDDLEPASRAGKQVSDLVSSYHLFPHPACAWRLRYMPSCAIWKGLAKSGFRVVQVLSRRYTKRSSLDQMSPLPG